MGKWCWVNPGAALLAGAGRLGFSFGIEPVGLQSHEQLRGGSAGHSDAAGVQGPLPRAAAHQGGAGLLPQPLPCLAGGEGLPGGLERTRSGVGALDSDGKEGVEILILMGRQQMRP